MGKFMMNGIEYAGGGSGGGGGNVDDVYVNGESVLDSDKIAQITSYKELTLAEYMALPSSKTSDGVMYCIKDFGGANQFPPLIFSEQEKEVGVWIDGKPIYELTVHNNTLNPATNVEVNVADLSSYNIEHVVSITGIDFMRRSNVQKYLPNASYFMPFYNKDTKYLMFRQSYTSYAEDDLYITIRYTKTTDTAGSGTWTKDGTYAKHYSYDEHIIGTYADGSTLYEKTIPAFTFSSGQTTVTHNLNIDAYISITGWVCVNNDMTQKFAFPFVQNRWGGYCQPIQESANFLIIDASWSNNKAELTLQYTKKTA